MYIYNTTTMHFPQLIIKTVENFKDITLFPFIQKSYKTITIAYDIIPIKYEGKNKKFKHISFVQFLGN